MNNIGLLHDTERVNGSWNRGDTFEVELSVHVMARSADTGRRTGRRENFGTRTNTSLMIDRASWNNKFLRLEEIEARPDKV